MRTALPLAAGLLVTAALSGCGDDPDASSRASTQRPGTTASATASATAGATAGATATGSASAPATTPTPSATGAAAGTPASTGSPGATGTAASSAAPGTTSAAPAVRLTGDGLDLGDRVVGFGASYEQARPLLDAALGRPTTDTGVTESFGPYGTCPGTRLRALEYGGGALQVLFGDVEGETLTMYQWALTDDGTPSRVPPASALVGDAATYEFGVGTAVAELRDGARPATVEVSPGDEVFPASFRLQDQSPGFFGYLTGPGPRDTATFVQGGEGCGE